MKIVTWTSSKQAGQMIWKKFFYLIDRLFTPRDSVGGIRNGNANFPGTWNLFWVSEKRQGRCNAEVGIDSFFNLVSLLRAFPKILAHFFRIHHVVNPYFSLRIFRGRRHFYLAGHFRVNQCLNCGNIPQRVTSADLIRCQFKKRQNIFQLKTLNSQSLH